MLGVATMAKAETIAIIRSVVAASGIALVREGSDGPVQRFQGHALRVSGAQFLSRCQVPLSTTMLLGRWGGGRSVEHYVQDSALSEFQILPQLARQPSSGFTRHASRHRLSICGCNPAFGKN